MLTYGCVYGMYGSIYLFVLHQCSDFNGKSLGIQPELSALHTYFKWPTLSEYQVKWLLRYHC